MKFLGEKEKAKIVNKTWIAHKIYNYSVCILYNSQQKKGKLEKKVRQAKKC